MGEVEAEPLEVDRQDTVNLEQILEDQCKIYSKAIQVNQDKIVVECSMMLSLLANMDTHLLPINIKVKVNTNNLPIEIISKVEQA